ncbi:glycosyltransferase family 2 protein [Pseudarthrobacter sp. J1738]|uniref:glycosyltransferase family 2 protein n=1 Tax=Pseudarthrobacter sp. J1738 TaxID=3420446 RepID=UPI003D2BB850
MRVLKGIGKWQAVGGLIASAGLLATVVGSILDLRILVVAGFALFSWAALAIIVTNGRTSNLRTKQIKSALARLEKRDKRPDSNEAAKKSDSPVRLQRAEHGIGPEFEYASRMDSAQSQLETFALRSRSQDIRNAFARRATNGQSRFADLMRQVAVFDVGGGSSVFSETVPTWRPEAMLSLARILVNQQSLRTDVEDAARLFKLVEKQFGTQKLGRTDRFIYLEALGILGADRTLQDALSRFRTKSNFPVQASLLSLNAIGLKDQATTNVWLERLNELIEGHALAPVAMVNPQVPSIDTLRTNIDQATIDGPLVTVIVPTYNGADLIDTALSSLTGQTWRNLEIIVVDDHSDEEQFARLQQACAVDPRIVLKRQSSNLGPYCARNLGLSVARGEFVTIHDDDDWSHAQKIELQVQALLETPAVAANMSQHVRCTPEINFLRINNNPQFTQPNFSSLMVRRSILEQLGGWDAVNRGADAEFRDRLVKFTGQAVPVVGQVPLSFTRTRTGSLTAGELSRGYVDPSRLLYMFAYQAWHERAENSGSFAINNEPSRPFVIPRNMQPGPRNGHLGDYDVVFATDFKFPGGTTALTLTEIRLASSSGLRVGVIQIDSPLNSFSSPIASGLFEVTNVPNVDILGLNDRANVALLVVRHPSVVTFLDGAKSNLVVGSCVLIVNNPPFLRDGSGMVFDLRSCLLNLDSLFNVAAMVLAESKLTRELCVGLVESSRLSEDTWPGVIDVVLSSPALPSESSAILGRHSRDHGLKWPSRIEDFEAAYKSKNGEFSTSILGGADSLIKKFGPSAIAGIKVHPFGSMNVSQFLTGVHFWAYFHDDQLTESFGMAAAEAMAAGKVVFLPAYMEKTFANGAVYCSPDEVSELVSKFSRDSDLYLAQSAKAQAVVEARFSRSALLQRISKFSIAQESGTTPSGSVG